MTVIITSAGPVDPAAAASDAVCDGDAGGPLAAPSEAKLSAITGFRHFSALDLTSEVTG